MLFRCKNCGGNAVYSPGQMRMYCPHCDGTDSAEREIKENKTECANCGAPLAIQEYNSTCRCEYCGSYIILDERVEGAYRPNLMLPFKVDKKKAVELLAQEFKSRIFTPGSFLGEATLEEMKGMYIPFWMYDYTVSCDYVGRGTKVRVWTSGDTEYTETSHYRVERNLDVDFDKLPIDASFAMNDEVMDLMEPYDYKDLEEFQEKYMSGFYGEVYNEDADALEERADRKTRMYMDDILDETLGGYSTLVPERKDVSLARDKVHFALLPVWRYIYKYRDKNYDFYVNGQTGKIIGSTPVSMKKVLAYGGTVLAAVWLMLSFIAGILEVM